MIDPSAKRNPHRIDVHVGGRIRLRRRILGLSQKDLAVALSLTFQQVQKYERGSNRVSASKLYQIARTLQVAMTYFFEDVDDAALGEGALNPDQPVRDFLASADGLELAGLFPRLARGIVRRRVLDLVRSLAEEYD